MKFLRTVPTRRLLAMIAGLVAAIAGGTAIAVAAAGSGPVAPGKPLAQAIHDSLAGPQVAGISADITFTNHLIDSSDIIGVDPILTGASGRLWASGDNFRLELQGSNGFNQDAQVVVSKGSFWVYDPTASTVYRGTLPQHENSGTTDKHQIPSIARIQQTITDLMKNADVSGAQAGDVGGRPAYTVRISPKHDGGLLGAAELAWDAAHAVPLRVAIYAAGDANPVLELKASNVQYGAVDPSVFAISPPADAKVVNVASRSLTGGADHKAPQGRKRHETKLQRSTSVSAIARKLKFALVAPDKLVGLPRHSVSLVGFGKQQGAVVTYGQHLGGIVVLEQPAGAGNGSLTLPRAGGGEDRRGLSLPSVSINGTTGHELDTALGTLVTFTRGGVTYTVLGSVPPVAADAAARAL